MSLTTPYHIDPTRDLVLERIVDVPRERVWSAWTNPEELKQWFAPRPWLTVECEIDLRPGGIFRTVMRSPDGQEGVNVGCYLELLTNKRLVWTDALLPGFRPSIASSPIPSFTAIITLEPHGSGTRYTAIAMHKDEATCARHAELGFHAGWGQALDQLVSVVKGR
jgi:uncharacterized protein YndB with AHSA1/START domain